MPADPALSAPAEEAQLAPAVTPPLLTAVPRVEEPYVPSNSVFRMAETAGGEAYVPEWSGLVDISEEVARSGVPVQLALTSTPSEPPIPISADVFPILRAGEPIIPVVKDPVWKVEEPLAAPVDQLFPTAGATPATAFPTEAFPAAAFPTDASHAPSPVPLPSGESFPGIVPTVAPTMFAEPPAPTAPPAPVAPIAVAPVAPVAPPAPVATVEPVAPLAPVEPVAPLAPAAPVAPEPTIYAGPPPVEVAPDPVAPPNFQPFAASTPGASYVPVAPRPIPQPLQLGAPSIPATSSELVPATPYTMPTPPAEYWPTQGTPPPGVQNEPTPGAYVPFDPSAVHLEPVPVIPFSSRDPFNSASTARPGMRAYAAAPIGPSGSTWTGGLAFMLLAPLISTATFFVWTQLTPLTQLSVASTGWLPFAFIGIGLIGLASAQFDRNALARRGYFDLASPFWVLLIPPLVYLIVRALRLRGQGKGAGAAIGLLLLSSVAANVLIGLVSVGWLSAPTPERVAYVETTMQQQLAAKQITAKVTCPAVTSFSPGATFDCTAVTQGSSLSFRVTVVDWEGDFTAVPVTSATS